MGRRPALDTRENASPVHGCTFGLARVTDLTNRVGRAARPRSGSAAVVGVDADVVVREVAGPDGGGGLAAAQVHADGDFRLFHDALTVFLAVGGVAAAPRDHVHVVEVHLDEVLVEVVDAGVAHGGQDAAEGGVGGEERGLDQGRVGDGVGGQGAFGFGAAALDGDADELGGAFAVAHDGLGQLLRDLDERGAQGLAVGAVHVGDFGVRGLAGGDQHEAVVGRGVAVDGDAVERGIGRVCHQALQQGRGDVGVGG